jgi:hypothetical protein
MISQISGVRFKEQRNLALITEEVLYYSGGKKKPGPIILDKMADGANEIGNPNGRNAEDFVKRYQIEFLLI